MTQDKTDWVFDHVSQIVVGFILFLITVIVLLGIADSKRNKARCNQAWQIARTSTDSLMALQICAGEKPNTVIIPIYQ